MVQPADRTVAAGNTEEYWSKAVVRLNEVWNGSTDNPLLMKLLLLCVVYRK